MSQGRRTHYLGERIDGVTNADDEKSNQIRHSRSSGKRHYSQPSSQRRPSGKSPHSSKRDAESKHREPLPKLDLSQRTNPTPRSRKRLSYYQQVSEPAPIVESPNSEMIACKKRLEKLREILSSPNTTLSETELLTWQDQVDRLFLKIIQKKSANIAAEISLLEAVINADEHKKTIGRDKGRVVLKKMMTETNDDLLNIAEEKDIRPKVATFQSKSSKPGFFSRVFCCTSTVEHNAEPKLDKQKRR